MNIYLLIAETVVLTLLDYCLIFFSNLVSVKGQERIHFAITPPKGWKQIVCFLLIPISIAGAGVMLGHFYKLDVFFVTKRLVLLAILWVAAACDYREYRIPNKLLIIGLILWVLIVPFEMLMAWESFLPMLLSEGIAAVAVTLICMIFVLIAKGSLGMGDVKLLGLMGLFLGIEGLIYSVIYSLVIAFFAAIILLITKKKKKKDHLAFAPFLLFGTIACLILSGV